VPGVSDNIRVISIVGRFLEHCRIFYFRAGGEDEVYLASADWMNRNLSRRVEIMFPVEDPVLKRRVLDILGTRLRDNVKARELRPDGRYVRVKQRKGQPRVDSQALFMARALEEHAPELEDAYGAHLLVHQPTTERPAAAPPKLTQLYPIRSEPLAPNGAPLASESANGAALELRLVEGQAAREGPPELVDSSGL
ncbi:MAG TPA: hypothetical protein VFU47_08710, partial [Armatimonadota bacterium]|nr:hypothetical protein [Armatimonadota bacterium]